MGDQMKEANGELCSKRHILHAVELSQRSGKPCANCVDPSHTKQLWPDNRFLASGPCVPAGWLAILLIKADDVVTILVRLPHTNKSEFTISATDKYKLGSRYR